MNRTRGTSRKSRNRYVFSLTNSKLNQPKRPKLLSENLQNEDFAQLATGPTQSEIQRDKQKRKRKRTRTLGFAFIASSSLFLYMDGLRMSQPQQLDLMGVSDVNESRWIQSNQNMGQGLRGATGGYYEKTDTGIYASSQSQEIPNYNYAPVSSLLSERQRPAYDSLLNEVASKVTDLLKDGTKQLEDMVVGNTNAFQLPSGLQPSPGKPVPNNQDIELERKSPYEPTKYVLSRVKTDYHEIANLNCRLYGGPKYDIHTRDLIYWEDIKQDDHFVSPFYYENKKGMHEYSRDSKTKYVSFEPDPGGFNNNRMAFEMYLVLSAAMGRTLVLPPKHKIPLLTDGSGKQQALNMEDFFHLHTLNKEVKGVNIITMEEFLLREAASGHFNRYASDEKLLPPHNSTEWDMGEGPPIEELWEYLNTVGYKADKWNNNCIAAFPKDASGNSIVQEMMEEILNMEDGRDFPNPLDYQGRPVPYSAPPQERLREMLAGRRSLCLYDEEMQDATLVHFPSGRQGRPFMQYYSFIFFEDPKHAIWSHRLVRDHLRYHDLIMCAAARVMIALRMKMADTGDESRIYHSLHLRRKRGSFDDQYSDGVVSDEELLKALSDVKANSTLFISTDEQRDNSIFTKLKQKYHIFFLDDFQDLYQGLNPNYLGMIEQIVASKANTFFGTYFSTFSSYIVRMRGYHSTRNELDGHDDGILRNTFYTTPAHRNEMGIYKSPQRPFFAREFPISWRVINRGARFKSQ